MIKVAWRGRPRPRAHVQRRRFCGRDAVDGGDEAVSTAGQGFEEARARSEIAQRLANFVHRRIQAVIEIDESIGGPDFFAQVVARDHLTGILQQGSENLKRLFLKPYASAVFAQLSGGQVDFKNAKAQEAGSAVGGRHRHEGAPVVYREADIGR